MQHVVVTGGTRGIGKGLATEFLRNNCRVSLTGRDRDSVDSMVESLKNLTGNKHCHGFVCDITRLEDLEDLWNRTSEIQPIQIWINNAGINHLNRHFHRLDKQIIQEVLNTNINGTILASKVILDGMLKQGSGFLYNMEGFGSDGRMMEGVSIYGTSKRAVRYFTRTLIKEQRNSQVKIGTISPGMVITDLLLEPLLREPENNQNALRIFHVLSDTPEKVTPWLVSKILQNKKHGTHIAWLTNGKIAMRFLGNMFKKRRVKGLPHH